ncbi:MAG: class I SAM-dependent methyltransferase [Ruminococcaceae bacterium]|nr:class I SAM-dependent methyltransferase [Oscillospiraceae bacterium]
MSRTDWSWKHNTDSKWLIPDPQAYYLAQRWMHLDYLTVLDHGCGLGRHSVFFSKEGFVVTAFDQSATGLEHTAKWAARDGAALRTVSGDMKSIPLPDSSFDAVMCYNVIYHAGLEDVKQAAKEISRVMKPGGELFITMCSKSSPNYLNANTVLDDGCTVPAQNTEANSTSHCYLNYEEMVSLFEDFEFAAEPVDQLEYENGKLKNAHWVLLLRKK